MLNRLKAALAVLFSKEYMVATVPKGANELDLDVQCARDTLTTVAAHCVMLSAQAIEREKMQNLVEQAKMIVER